MKILYKYIILNFFATFFFTTVILLSISIIIDLTDKMRFFMENKPPWDILLYQYYLQFIFYCISMFSPLAIFISAIVATTKLCQNSEIIAMLSGGMSFNSLLLPYFYGASFLVMLALFSNHWLVPESNKIRLLFESKYTHKNVFSQKNDFILQIAKNEIIYVKSFDPTNNLAYQFTYQKFNKKYQLESEIHSTYITFSDSTYRLDNYYMKKRLPSGKYDLSYGDQKDTLLNFFITDFTTSKYSADMLNTSSLAKFIDKETLRGAESLRDYIVKKHERSSLPFATYILVFLAVAISYKKKRGGMGINLALGCLAALTYIFIFKIFNTLALKLNAPIGLVVWTPNILFVFVSVLWYQHSKK